MFAALLLLAAFSFAGSGCRLLKRDKQSVAEKKQHEADKKVSAEYDKALDQHYKNQSNDAKKMMKKTKKQASRFNKPMKRKGNTKSTCR